MPTTNERRIADIRAALDELPAAFAAAESDPDNTAKWEVVERLGATVHRRGRLLAGKARGG